MQKYKEVFNKYYKNLFESHGDDEHDLSDALQEAKEQARFLFAKTLEEVLNITETESNIDVNTFNTDDIVSIEISFNNNSYIELPNKAKCNKIFMHFLPRNTTVVEKQVAFSIYYDWIEFEDGVRSTELVDKQGESKLEGIFRAVSKMLKLLRDVQYLSSNDDYYMPDPEDYAALFYESYSNDKVEQFKVFCQALKWLIRDDAHDVSTKLNCVDVDLTNEVTNGYRSYIIMLDKKNDPTSKLVMFVFQEPEEGSGRKGQYRIIFTNKARKMRIEQTIFLPTKEAVEDKYKEIKEEIFNYVMYDEATYDMTEGIGEVTIPLFRFYNIKYDENGEEYSEIYEMKNSTLKQIQSGVIHILDYDEEDILNGKYVIHYKVNDSLELIYEAVEDDGEVKFYLQDKTKAQYAPKLHQAITKFWKSYLAKKFPKKDEFDAEDYADLFD